jgi:hypothetical protein
VRFWHGYLGRRKRDEYGGKALAVVGITPEDAASLKAGGEIPELREIVA